MAKEKTLPPKDPKTVKHGCASCVDYRTDAKRKPCKDCHGFSHWRDAHPGKPY